MGRGARNAVLVASRRGERKLESRKKMQNPQRAARARCGEIAMESGNDQVCGANGTGKEEKTATAAVIRFFFARTTLVYHASGGGLSCRVAIVALPASGRWSRMLASCRSHGSAILTRGNVALNKSRRREISGNLRRVPSPSPRGQERSAK